MIVHLKRELPYSAGKRRQNVTESSNELTSVDCTSNRICKLGHMLTVARGREARDRSYKVHRVYDVGTNGRHLWPHAVATTAEHRRGDHHLLLTIPTEQ